MQAMHLSLQHRQKLGFAESPLPFGGNTNPRCSPEDSSGSCIKATTKRIEATAVMIRLLLALCHTTSMLYTANGIKALPKLMQLVYTHKQRVHSCASHQLLAQLQCKLQNRSESIGMQDRVPQEFVE